VESLQSKDAAEKFSMFSFRHPDLYLKISHRRSFHAGKLDLVQVEGLCDLIHAETEEQRRQV